MSTTEQNPTRGFALLIKAPSVERRFVPLQGETIVIFDEEGKELWSIKLPGGIDNPGVILHEVQIDLLTERDFGLFCQQTWGLRPPAQPDSQPPPGPPPG